MATIYGTNGIDRVYGTNDADTIILYDGDDHGVGNGGNDTIYGYGGNDTLSGRDGDDVLSGMDGYDLLLGGNGSDYLFGGTGGDVLVGGSGADRLYGGAQADTFRFDVVSDAYGDQINDFNRYEGDKINLANIDAKDYSLFSSSTWGNNTFSFIGTNSFTGAGQINYFHSGGNTYVQASTDGDSAAEFTIKLTGTHTLQFSDFVL